MRLTNGQIFDITEALAEIQQDEKIKFPAKTAYKIAFNMKQLMPTYQLVLQTRAEVASKYGTLQEGGNIFLPQDKIPIVNAELAELAALEQDIQLYDFNLEELSAVNMSVGTMITLMPLICEDLVNFL